MSMLTRQAHRYIPDARYAAGVTPNVHPHGEGNRRAGGSRHGRRQRDDLKSRLHRSRLGNAFVAPSTSQGSVEVLPAGVRLANP